MKFYITGTPGCGKSTLSSALNRSLGNFDVYEIKDLLIKFNLLEEYEPDRDTTVFDDVLAVETIQNFLKGKDNFILVGPCIHFKEIDFSCIIVVTCSLKALLEERLAKRGYKKSKIQDNLEAELVGEILGEAMDFFSEKYKLLVLDSCKNSPDELIVKIKKFLEFR